MIKKRYIILAVGIISVLLASLLVNSIILAQSGGEYDPWMDLNDDGVIDVNDLQLLAFIYATSGIPINKTELLLELEARIDSLNASLLADYYDKIDCDSLFAPSTHTHDWYDITGMPAGFADGIDDDTTYSAGTGLSLIGTVFSILADSITSEMITDGTITGSDISTSASLTIEGLDVNGNLNVGGNITMNTVARYYTVPGLAWLPGRDLYTFSRSGSYIYTSTPGDIDFYAPVYLPNGAVVIEVRAWVWDNDPGEDITVELYRSEATTGDSWLMASITSSGSSSSYRAFSENKILNSTIDNQNNAYFLTGVLRMDSSMYHRLGQVRITYTITEPLP